MTGAGTLPASWGPRVPFKKSSTSLVMVGMHGRVVVVVVGGILQATEF